MITEIKAISKNKMQVLFDGEPAFTADRRTLRELGITDGAEWDEAGEAGLRARVTRLACRSAMDLLLQRNHSRRQLADKLIRKGFAPEYAEAAVDYVDSYHYLDDTLMAVRFLEGHDRTMSRQEAFYKLKAKGLSSADIEAAFETAGWENWEAAASLIDAKFRDRSLPEGDERERLYRSLIRKGFSASDIRRALSHLEDMRTDIE